MSGGRSDFDFLNSLYLATTTAALADLTIGGLALNHHLTVLANAVPLLSRNLVAVLKLVLLLGCPGKVVTADLDVVVGELAQLVIVHTEQLGFLGGTQVQTRDGVDGESDQGGHDERVRGSSDNVGDLDVELLVVVNDPSSDSRASVDTVQANNRIVTEQSIEDQTDNTSDTVLSQHIHRVVNADPELDLGRVIAYDAGHDTQDHARPGANETRSWSRRDQSRDGAGTPADHGPLASQTPIEQNPSNGTESGSQVGVPGGHRGTQVSTKGGTTVESEPAEPEKNSTEKDERHVVRAEVEHHAFLSAAENHGIGESSKPGSDFDGTTTSVVHHTILVCPSIHVPRPAGEGAVHNSSPDECKHHSGKKPTALSHSTHDDSSSDGTELHLQEKTTTIKNCLEQITSSIN